MIKIIDIEDIEELFKVESGFIDRCSVDRWCNDYRFHWSVNIFIARIALIVLQLL